MSALNAARHPLVAIWAARKETQMKAAQKQMTKILDVHGYVRGQVIYQAKEIEGRKYDEYYAIPADDRRAEPFNRMHQAVDYICPPDETPEPIEMTGSIEADIIAAIDAQEPVAA